MNKVVDSVYMKASIPLLLFTLVPIVSAASYRLEWLEVLGLLYLAYGVVMTVHSILLFVDSKIREKRAKPGNATRVGKVGQLFSPWTPIGGGIQLAMFLVFLWMSWGVPLINFRM